MKALKRATGLFWPGGLACLPLLLGCGHPSAASPVTDRAVASSALKTTGQESTNEQVRQADSSAHQAAWADQATAQPSESNDGSPAAQPAPTAGQRPPADRGPSRPGEAEKITFDDLNLGMQADVVFRPFMVSDRVKELEGKRISIVGYMHGGQATQRGIKEFILLKNTQCKFGPGGQADHLATVILKPDASTAFTPSPVKVEGTLKVEPFQGPDGNTWSIYRLEGSSAAVVH